MDRVRVHEGNTRLIVGLLAAAFGLIVLLAGLVLYLPRLGEQVRWCFLLLRWPWALLLVLFCRNCGFGVVLQALPRRFCSLRSTGHCAYCYRFLSSRQDSLGPQDLTGLLHCGAHR